MEILEVLVIILVLWNFILTVSSLRINDKTDDAYDSAKNSPRKYKFERLERDLGYLENRVSDIRDDYLEDHDILRTAVGKLAEHFDVKIVVVEQKERDVKVRELEEEQEDN